MKVGEKAYDPVAFVARGGHELGNALYPESPIPLRDHAGLYGHEQEHAGQPAAIEPDTPELEHDDPELEL